jgi:hypothetical protein
VNRTSSYSRALYVPHILTWADRILGADRLQGIVAISQLLKSSIDRFYTGSKLRLVEVVADGLGKPQEKWWAARTAPAPSVPLPC